MHQFLNKSDAEDTGASGHIPVSEMIAALTQQKKGNL